MAALTTEMNSSGAVAVRVAALYVLLGRHQRIRCGGWSGRYGIRWSVVRGEGCVKRGGSLVFL